MTKDRLADLVDVQSDCSEGNDLFVNIIDRPHNDSMQEFLAEVEELRQMIEDIQAKVKEVKIKHSDILSAPHTDENTKMMLDALMANIKQTANKVRFKLKLIEQSIEKEHEKLSTADQRIRTNQHSTLTRMFVEVLMHYNRIQTEYRDRFKAKLQRQLDITGRTTTSKELDEMLEQDNPAIFTQGIFMETRQARQTFADIEARHADIVQLENSIRELHDMFVDMAVLVESQGQLVDNIEYHVTKTASFVGDGTTALNQGRVWRRKARRKKMFIVICLAVVAIIFISALIPSLT